MVTVVVVFPGFCEIEFFEKGRLLVRDDLILVVGPEGSGTTYIWKGLVNANPGSPIGRGIPNNFLDPINSFPNSGIYHISLPTARPAAWLDEVVVPKHAKFVICVRPKEFAIESSHRRFGGRNKNTELESAQYERAMKYVRWIEQNYRHLTIQYCDLEKRQEEIVQFLGFPGLWPPFQSQNHKYEILGRSRPNQESNSHPEVLEGVRLSDAVKVLQTTCAPSSREPNNAASRNPLSNSARKIKAICLTHDANAAVMDYVIHSYQRLWPNNPLVFHVPYNGARPIELEGRYPQKVCLHHTPKSIRATMHQLLKDIDDEEWVWWCMDNNCPIWIAKNGLSELAKSLERVGDPNLWAVMVTRNSMNTCALKTSATIRINGSSTRFEQKAAYDGFLQPHFVRSKVLKELFSSGPLVGKNDQDIENEKLWPYLLAKVQERLPSGKNVFLPYHTLLTFSQTICNGKVTSDTVARIKQEGKTAPDLEECDQGWFTAKDGRVVHLIGEGVNSNIDRGPKKLKLRPPGMFSNVNEVVENLHLAKQSAYTFEISWASSCYADDTRSGDPWNYYFEPCFDVVAGNDADHLRVGSRIASNPNNVITPGNFDGERHLLTLPKDREYPHRLIREHLKLKPHVTAEIERFYADYDWSQMVGLHLRGLGRGKSGAGMLRAQTGVKGEIDYSRYLNPVDAVLKTNAHVKVFACSDSQDVIDYLSDYYGDRLITYPATRSSFGELHESHENNKGMSFSPYKLGLDVLVEAYLLSRTSYFVHGNSNVANFILCLNPKLSSYYVYADLNHSISG